MKDPRFCRIFPYQSSLSGRVYEVVETTMYSRSAFFIVSKTFSCCSLPSLTGNGLRNELISCFSGLECERLRNFQRNTFDVIIDFQAYAPKLLELELVIYACIKWASAL